MHLYLAAPLASVILKLPARRVEGVSYRHVHISMRLMLLGFPTHHQLGARDSEVDPDVI